MAKKAAEGLIVVKTKTTLFLVALDMENADIRKSLGVVSKLGQYLCSQNL